MNYFLSSTFIKVAGCSILIFIVLDLLWLSVVARTIYFKQMSYLAAVENGRIVFNLPVGLSVQAIIALGLAVFISLALLVDNTLAASLCVGAFAGFVMYCTYDLTNLSFIRNYPVSITVVDIAWGTAQGIFAGIYVFYLTRYFSP
ncbi:MAG: DUF2177 family protein [Spirochaetales bacterium]|jgi:uncharacterized membrane protein|nr:DUF2177 family protein [Spirochaetales bacterium]